MTQDEIIRMANEACQPHQILNTDLEFLIRFAALVAAHERKQRVWITPTKEQVLDALQKNGGYDPDMWIMHDLCKELNTCKH